jgi:predicted nuclease of predicted toxin-antitoxin system
MRAGRGPRFRSFASGCAGYGELADRARIRLCVVPKDEDFAEWSRLREPAPAVLWLRIGNLKKVELRAKLVPLLPELVQRLQAGETLIEVF